MSSSPTVTVQALQSASPWTSHNSPTSTRSPLRISPHPALQQIVSRYHQSLSHAHPEPPRWSSTEGSRLRHVHDNAPFTLWDFESQEPRNPTREESHWILETFEAEDLFNNFTFLIVKTKKPPNPVPLTIGTCPAIFCLPDHSVKSLRGDVYYSNPRLPDPCSDIRSSLLGLPTPAEMSEIGNRLSSQMNCEELIFSSHHILVVLVHGDNREYDCASLPGRVANRPTSYHHGPDPFFSATRNLARRRILDPRSYLDPEELGPMPQDGTNYLVQPAFNMICPGVRVSSGHSMEDGEVTDRLAFTTCGIRLRKGTEDRVTVANHGFLHSNDVYHPHAGPGGELIGQIVDRYPELDVALVKLNPSHLARFKNDNYFQAEAPKRLVGKHVKVHEWYEVDGMSSGLISLFLEGVRARRPVRPPNFPAFEHTYWTTNNIHRVFGGIAPMLVDGMCGAPIVETDTGAVAGFFHLVQGDGWAISATIDDLIAEGWDVVE